MRSTIIICSLFFLALSSCTGAKRPVASSNDSDGRTVVSVNGYGQTDTINNFNGAATSEEMDILLTNSQLDCSSGQMLLFDGATWQCGDVATTSMTVDEDALACDEGKMGDMRKSSVHNGLDVCQDFLRLGQYMWIPSTGAIHENITVNIPVGNCNRLVSVVRDLVRYRFENGYNMTINIPDGTYNCNSPINIFSHSLKDVEIIGNTTSPANVNLIFDQKSGVRLNHGSLGLLDGVTITGTGDTTGKSAIRAEKGSHITLGSKILINDWDDTDSYGILALEGSSVKEDETWNASDHLVMNNVFVGAYFNSNSSGELDYIEISSLYPGVNDSRGIMALHSSYVVARNANISNAYYGIYSNRASSVLANDITIDKAYSNAIAFNTAHLVITDATLTNCDKFCVEASRGGYVDAVNVSASCTTNTATYGFITSTGSQMYANGASMVPSSCATEFQPVPGTPDDTNMIWP